MPKTTVLETLRLAKNLFAPLKVPFPAVSCAKSAMKEQVGFLPWNLEADKVFTRGNRLSAFAAKDGCALFHGSPTALCLVFLVGQLVLDLF